jgi:hypothetical protein
MRGTLPPQGPDPSPVAAYALAQLLVTLAATTWLLFRQQVLSAGTLAAGSVSVLASVASVGGLLEGRRWAWPMEAARSRSRPP